MNIINITQSETNLAFKVNKKDMKFKCHNRVFLNKSFEM